MKPQTSIGLDESDRAALEIIQQRYHCTMAQAVRIALADLAARIRAEQVQPGPGAAFLEQWQREQNQ